ncbi:MAG: hypothetical protein N2319_00020 [Candidatus Kapabacteria bacterium]|nr:hypothetical protein [Candidatus Kapabacteria bacterium]
MKILILTILSLASLFIFDSCNDPIVTSGKNIIFPDSNVSYQYHVQPLLRYTCNYPGCHDITNPIMATYFDLIIAGAGSIVRPGDPDRSRLIYILEGKEPHYPYVYWEITENQRKGLRKWIAEGAQNN